MLGRKSPPYFALGSRILISGVPPRALSTFPADDDLRLFLQDSHSDPWPLQEIYKSL